MGWKSLITTFLIFILGIYPLKEKNDIYLFFIPTSMDVALILISLSGLLIACLLRVKRNCGIENRYFIKRNKKFLRETATPKRDALWFNIQYVKDATHNFNPTNLIG